jgi:hypothetical protein
MVVSYIDIIVTIVTVLNHESTSSIFVTVLNHESTSSILKQENQQVKEIKV